MSTENTEANVADKLAQALRDIAEHRMSMYGNDDFFHLKKIARTALAVYELEKAKAAPGLIFTDEMRADLIRDTGEVFERNGPYTPQIVRDVIEYVDSALQVLIGRAHDKAKAAPAAPVAVPLRAPCATCNGRGYLDSLGTPCSKCEAEAVEQVKKLKAWKAAKLEGGEA